MFRVKNNQEESYTSIILERGIKSTQFLGNIPTSVSWHDVKNVDEMSMI